ncbi:MAG TPA: hypothetical protein VFR86_24995 [Burkholderiaceae bacterium]|nr:hypothetical protein [Burkholderiaceae bacterium]
MPRRKTPPPVPAPAGEVTEHHWRMTRRRQTAQTPSLPHERDQMPDAPTKKTGSRSIIEQGARDIERGLVDTEARGIPDNVPAPRRRKK